MQIYPRIKTAYQNWTREVKNFLLINGLSLVIMMLSLQACTTAQSPTATPSAALPETPLASILLPVPVDLDHRDYLGIKPGEVFRLQDIHTQVLIIEVFNHYCIHCQREAPNVNRFYQNIIRHPEWRDRIKIIGIGVSNTAYEVGRFRKKYDIQFPLFPDRSRDIARQLEIRQTPTFVGLVWDADGIPRRFMNAPGSMGNVDEFLARVIQTAALETSHP